MELGMIRKGGSFDVRTLNQGREINYAGRLPASSSHCTPIHSST